MQRRSSATQWRKWLAEFEVSNRTIAKFCDSVGTSAASFYKWRHGLNVEALGATGLIVVERRQRQSAGNIASASRSFFAICSAE